MGGKKQNPTYAPLNPQMQDYYSKVQGSYDQANPQLQQAQQLYGDTAAGKYLYGGEGFNAALQAAQNKIIPDVESRFARGGRLDSGLARAAEVGGIGDAFANLYGQERGLQQQAGAALPGLSNMSQYANYASPMLGALANQQPIYPGSKGAGMLGGAIGGAQLGNMFGLGSGMAGGTAAGLGTIGALGGPAGMALGAGIGALAGRYL